MMAVMLESTSFTAGIPVFRFVGRSSRAADRWQQQQPPRQRKRRAIARCQYKKEWNPMPDVDTRIHWSSPEEGWVGGDDPSSSSSSSTSSLIDDLLSSFNSPEGSYYEFLGIGPDADVDGIRAAYRKLSKLYHPDSTSLPTEEAARKFLTLQRAYEILSSSEERRLYDWGLAQQISTQEGRGVVWPYEVQETLQGSGFKTKVVSQTQKRQEDGYYEFSGQQVAALAFDVFALIFSLLVVLYVAIFKHK